MAGAFFSASSKAFLRLLSDSPASLLMISGPKKQWHCGTQPQDRWLNFFSTTFTWDNLYFKSSQSKHFGFTKTAAEQARTACRIHHFLSLLLCFQFTLRGCTTFSCLLPYPASHSVNFSVMRHRTLLVLVQACKRCNQIIRWCIIRVGKEKAKILKLPLVYITQVCIYHCKINELKKKQTKQKPKKPQTPTPLK